MPAMSSTPEGEELQHLFHDLDPQFNHPVPSRAGRRAEAHYIWRCGGLALLTAGALVGVAVLRGSTPAILDPVVAEDVGRREMARAIIETAAIVMGSDRHGAGGALSPASAVEELSHATAFGVTTVEPAGALSGALLKRPGLASSMGMRIMVGPPASNASRTRTRTATLTRTTPTVTTTTACHDAAAGERCYTGIEWVMREGIWAHPEWYPNQTWESRFEEFQEELHRQGQSHCGRPCKPVDVSRRRPGIPGAALDLPGLSGERRELTFYMYRAQNAQDYPLQNVDAASLSGVMWYLHNEIVPSHAPHRKYNITRIKRFQITMKNTVPFFNVHRRNFGSFVAFDKGRCSVPNCEDIWTHYGFLVGCELQNMDIAAYQSAYKTTLDPHCKPPHCNGSVWYSLPGPCPDLQFDEKSKECIQRSPGGLCDKVTGEDACTYSVTDAGELGLDELTGIEDYRSFYYDGKREFIGHLDKGIGCSFWDGKMDFEKSAARMERVKMLFKRNYPDLPGCDELEEPVCDFDGFYKDEFTWPVHNELVEST